ncbi:replicative DNA helicase, partial [Alsobacter sp. SYSU BS001988]
GGFYPGQLVILAGRPGMGKTTLALAIALNAARENGVFCCSLEMSAEELAERALAALAFDGRRTALTYRRIAEAASLSNDEVERLHHAKGRMANLHLQIEQQPGMTLGQVSARARQWKARCERAGAQLRLIVVDHIGLVRPSTRYAGNRVNEVSEISGGLKALAKELGCTVMALSQLSREVERRDDKRPVLSDLRDSGSIEQDADVVIAAYREGYYLERLPNLTPEQEQRLFDAQDQIEIEVLKQRQGPTGRFQLFASLPCNAVAELGA